MTPSIINIVVTVIFGFALLHTFLVKKFQNKAHHFPEGSVGENFFHLMGEVETVFGLWAIVLFVFLSFHSGTQQAIHHIESLNFTEPAFVFAIMVVASTKPVLQMATTLLQVLSKCLPLNKNQAFYLSVLCFGPLLGSFITEPAAMAVTAMILKNHLYQAQISDKLKYATLGLLFVNISIGGTLTHFAAPPVIMVAEKWGWDIPFMFTNFGLKAALAIFTSTSIVCFIFRKEFGYKIETNKTDAPSSHTPLWVTFFHLATLAVIVMLAHHPIIFIGAFLIFLGFATITKEYQEELKIREGLLVGLFLGGLVILGSLQRWWLEPLLTNLSDAALFFGAIGLTAITDNAALTYLGSLVPGLSDMAKYSLVAGSVIGGGLTIVANAPNPIGYGILNPSFGDEGISPLHLLLAALGPTLVAALFFWFLT